MKKLFLLTLFIVTTHAVTVEQLFNIKTIKVTKESVSATKIYNGYLQIADDKLYTIALTQDGFVRNLTAPNVYDRVTKGKKLFEFYSPEVYKAQIELLSAMKVNASLAKNIETKLKLYDVSEQNIKMVRQQKKASKYLPFYSPYTGVVIEKKITEGSAIKRGVEVYKIADLSSLWLIAKAYESDRTWIKEGAKVEVTVTGSKKVHEATISFINPIIDSKNRTIDFRVILDNKEGLLQPNSYATITIHQPSQSKLILPKSAVVTKGDKHFVFVPGEYEGEYKSKAVEAKRINGNQFEILSGLEEGESVVNNSLFLLDSDVSINGGV